MYQRDYLLAEVEKLALILAKLIGLKSTEESDKFATQLNDVLQDQYNIDLAKLTALDESEFIDHLNSADYSAEKLNALARMLDAFAEPYKGDDETTLMLRKILIIFDFLEKHHRYLSIENIDKRNTICKYLVKNP
jgi:hypothetical protein